MWKRKNSLSFLSVRKAPTTNDASDLRVDGFVQLSALIVAAQIEAHRETRQQLAARSISASINGPRKRRHFSTAESVAD